MRTATVIALRAQRLSLLADLEAAEGGQPDPLWLADRLDELAYLDRTLARLEGTPGPDGAPADPADNDLVDALRN